MEEKTCFLFATEINCGTSPITFQTHLLSIYLLYFDLRPGPKMLFQGDTPEGSDTFQWPVIERDRVGGLRLMIWVKVPLCHYSDAPEESNLWTAWQLFRESRLMTIKHSISKIQWAIVWALNYYVTQNYPNHYNATSTKGTEKNAGIEKK